MRILLTAAFVAFAAPVAAQDWLSYDSYAINETSKTGLVVIGLDHTKGGNPSYFTWRSYDPATGKLNERRLAGPGGALKGLNLKETLFAAKTMALKPNRIVNGDKRMTPGPDGIGFRMMELPPGDYVLEGYQVNMGQNRVLFTLFKGPVPAVRVEPGKVAYAGNVGFRAIVGEGAEARFVKDTPDAASAFLRQFPKVQASIETTPARRIDLQCVGRKTPFIPDLHCDRERTVLTEVVGEAAALPPVASLATPTSAP